MEQVLRMRRGSDDRAARLTKVPHMAGYQRRGVSGFSRGYEKNSQHELRSNSGHPPNPKDWAPGLIQGNSM
jgi:hypothetical protein